MQPERDFRIPILYKVVSIESPKPPNPPEKAGSLLLTVIIAWFLRQILVLD
ncbi:hypothetical protein M595_5265 [Lyngbya aestuarii BL J]|uniref:Uncharacterized protein n=1 Tax=Lyngbya aestuarii BL J TaxID=1348334 RepID=U7QDH8_9CYAN|nr:hypothetical protein M595_5265 [Lyngbya aestuarii BL J]